MFRIQNLSDSDNTATSETRTDIEPEPLSMVDVPFQMIDFSSPPCSQPLFDSSNVLIVASAQTLSTHT